MKVITLRCTRKDATYNKCFKFFATRLEHDITLKDEVKISHYMIEILF